MNHYIYAQILNMQAMAKTFGQSCELAAMKDDGQISKDEAQAMVEKAFTRMDRNADGAISADDFPKRPMWFR